MEFQIIFIMAMLSLVYNKEVHLSCKQIHAFVDGHNNRRLLLAQGKVPGQPAASEMNQVIWDEELYEKASKWANTKGGNFHAHNPDKTVPSGRFRTSENLYWFSTTNLKHQLDPDSALETWFIEHQNFTFGPLKRSHFSYGNPQIGHYTQMVWSKSVYLGCAISTVIEHGWKNFFVVCNYGPAGNYIKEAPFKTGNGAIGKLQCGTDNCEKPYGDKC